MFGLKRTLPDVPPGLEDNRIQGQEPASETHRRSCLVALYQSVCRMVVNRFEVFRFHNVLVDTLVTIQGRRHVANHVFDKFGIVVGTLGDVLLIRAFEQTVQLTRGIVFSKTHDVLDPHMAVGACSNSHVRALVVRAIVRYAL